MRLSPLMVLVLLIMVLGNASGRRDERKISGFVIGDAVYAPYNPFTSLFIQDPLFDYSLYPLAHVGDDEKRRLDRIYLPRTGRILADNYDIIVFRDARVTHFTPRQFADMENAFREEGLASVAAHSLSWSEAWLPTVLYDLSPISEYNFRFSADWRVRFHREREPVFTPFVELGMEKVTGWEYGTMKPKQGTTVWADMEPGKGPWLVSWRPGGGNAGVQWSFADKFDVTWWGSAPGARDTNPYAIDFATNLILYSLERDLISDIHARREARAILSTFRAQELLILSVLDWAEKFGANILPLTDELSEIELEADDAVDFYLDQDYDLTVSTIESLSARINEISKNAVALKDEALYWVYLSEWLSVTSVFILSGVIVWTLMVRRWKYREVRSTKMGS